MTDSVHETGDLPPTLLDEILNFLKSYSKRQGHAIQVKGVVSAAEAMKIVKRARKTYKKQR